MFSEIGMFFVTSLIFSCSASLLPVVSKWFAVNADWSVAVGLASWSSARPCSVVMITNSPAAALYLVQIGSTLPYATLAATPLPALLSTNEILFSVFALDNGTFIVMTSNKASGVLMRYLSISADGRSANVIGVCASSVAAPRQVALMNDGVTVAGTYQHPAQVIFLSVFGGAPLNTFATSVSLANGIVSLPNGTVAFAATDQGQLYFAHPVQGILSPLLNVGCAGGLWGLGYMPDYNEYVSTGCFAFLVSNGTTGQGPRTTGFRIHRKHHVSRTCFLRTTLQKSVERARRV